MELLCPPPSSSQCPSSPSSSSPPSPSSQHSYPLPFHASLPGSDPCLVTEGRKRNDFSCEEAPGALKDPETPPQTGHKVSCCGDRQAAELGPGWPKLMHLGIPLGEKQYRVHCETRGLIRAQAARDPAAAPTEPLGKPPLLLRSRITGVLAWPPGPRGLEVTGCSEAETCSPERRPGSGLAASRGELRRLGSLTPLPQGLRLFLPGALVQLPVNLSPGNPGLGLASADQDSGQSARMLSPRGRPVCTCLLHLGPTQEGQPSGNATPVFSMDTACLDHIPESQRRTQAQRGKVAYLGSHRESQQ